MNTIHLSTLSNGTCKLTITDEDGVVVCERIVPKKRVISDVYKLGMEYEARVDEMSFMGYA